MSDGRTEGGQLVCAPLMKIGLTCMASLSPNQPHVGLPHFCFKKCLLVFAARCGDSDLTPLYEETQRRNSCRQNLLLNIMQTSL